MLFVFPYLRRCVALVGLTAVASVVGVQPLAAQPGAGATTPAAAEQNTADQAGPAGQAFQAALTEWKALLAELRDIQTKYQTADESELANLEKQWEEKLAAGQAMVDELRAKAIAAFQEAPNADRELNQFLIKLLADDIRSDKYEPAWELSQVLLEGQCNEKPLNDLAGIAAFNTNQYDQAGELFAKAALDRSLSSQGEHFHGLVAEYKKLWEEEKALRDAEAKADDLPRVQLNTSEGEIVVELFENEAPETVGNFVSLVKKGFYNGLTFHRVIAGFMAQGGCPKGDGTGDPGYSIYDECRKENHRKHFRGSLSMAKEAAPDTGGSQFFITFVPTSHLNGQHTVFGRVVSGMDVLAKIHKPNPPEVEPTVIVEAKVLRDRGHEYVPHKVQ